MECTWNIHSKRIIYGLNKNRGREKDNKRAGTKLQGFVKNELELVEVQNASLYTHICSLHCELTVTGFRSFVKIGRAKSCNTDFALS